MTEQMVQRRRDANTHTHTHTHTHLRVPYALAGLDDISGGLHTEDDRESHFGHVEYTSLRNRVIN